VTAIDAEGSYTYRSFDVLLLPGGDSHDHQVRRGRHAA
jgi:hypothetical protein